MELLPLRSKLPCKWNEVLIKSVTRNLAEGTLFGPLIRTLARSAPASDGAGIEVFLLAVTEGAGDDMRALCLK